jgi:hypothetical protein
MSVILETGHTTPAPRCPEPSFDLCRKFESGPAKPTPNWQGNFQMGSQEWIVALTCDQIDLNQVRVIVAKIDEFRGSGVCFLKAIQT